MHPAFKIFIVAVALIALWLAAQSLRLHVFLKKTRALETLSATFSRDYQVGNPTDPAAVYVVLGDSTAVGTGSQTLEGSYAYQTAVAYASKNDRYVRVVNKAENGARAATVLENQIPTFKNLQPQLITLMIGANDATHFTSYESYRASLISICKSLEGTGAAILVADTPNMRFVPALPFPLTRIIGRRSAHQNDILQQELPAHFQKVELFNRGVLDARKNPLYYANDRFHPSELGYALWAQRFIERL